MQAVQLELFEPTENEKIRGEVRGIERMMDNVRRGMFARHDELGKKYLELREEVERLSEALHSLRNEMQTK